MKKILAILALVPLLAYAWEPTKPIKVIVPTAAGAGNEMAFRAAAAPIERTGKVTFVIENRAGADGNVGMNQFSEAAADGYTIAVPACQSTFVASDIHYKNIIKLGLRSGSKRCAIAKSFLNTYPCYHYSRCSTYKALIARALVKWGSLDLR